MKRRSFLALFAAVTCDVNRICGFTPIINIPPVPASPYSEEFIEATVQVMTAIIGTAILSVLVANVKRLQK